MSDFFESVWAQIRDRMSSPVFGSFVIAWLCWNHQYFIIIFSDLPVDNRLRFAGDLLYSPSEMMWKRLIFYPSASCLGYIIIYPLLARYLLAYWDWQQTGIENLRKKAQGKRVLSVAESDAITLEIIQLRATSNEIISRQAREMEALRKVKDESDLAKQLAGAHERMQTLETELERTRKESVPNNPLGHLDEPTKTGVRSVLNILAVSSGQRLSIEQTLRSLGQTSEARKKAFINAAMSAQLVGQSAAGSYYLAEPGLTYVVREELDK